MPTRAEKLAAVRAHEGNLKSAVEALAVDVPVKHPLVILTDSGATVWINDGRRCAETTACEVIDQRTGAKPA